RLPGELELRAVGLLALGRPLPLVAAGGLELAALHVVLEDRVESLVSLLPALRCLDREQQLDAAIQVARHPVGAREVDLLVAAVPEIVDARVPEEGVHNQNTPV